MLERTFGNTQTLNEGYANTLAGMLAARKRDWPEATRAYVGRAQSIFRRTQSRSNMQRPRIEICYRWCSRRTTEIEKPDRHEVENAIETLGRALLVLRARNLTSRIRRRRTRAIRAAANGSPSPLVGSVTRNPSRSASGRAARRRPEGS